MSLSSLRDGDFLESWLTQRSGSYARWAPENRATSMVEAIDAPASKSCKPPPVKQHDQRMCLFAPAAVELPSPVVALA